MFLSLPIVLGHLATMTMAVIDTAMVGRIGVLPVASASFAGCLLMFFYLFGVGLCVPIHILVPKLLSANKNDEILAVLQHSLLILGIIGIGIGLLFQYGDSFLYMMNQPVPVVDESLAYAKVMAWSLLPVLLFQCLKNYYEALNEPWVPIVILFIASGLNIFLNWLLIYGNWGLPSYGLFGAGIATALSRLFVFVVLFFIITVKLPLLIRRLRLDISSIRSIFALGLPTSMQILFEVTLFSFTAIMMGWIGETYLAAHQIALNIAALAFMVPLGISHAVSIRISSAFGRGEVNEYRKIGYGGVFMSVIFMSLYGVLIVLNRSYLPGLFVDDVETCLIVENLLLIAAFFALFDGVQVTMMGALRGLHDVVIPTGFVFFSFWIVGLFCAYYFGIVLDYKGQGVWSGLLASLVVASILFGIRFHYYTKQLIKNNS